MFIELEQDRPKGQQKPVALNVDNVWLVTPGLSVGLAGRPTTRLHFNNGQTMEIIGDMEAVLQKLKTVSR